MALFFGPKIKHPDEKVRLRALEKANDPKTLVEVACHDPSSKIRLEAVRRISDPAQLATVVKNGEGEETRVNAVSRIHDQQLLAQIILERKNYEIMKAAFEGITDSKVLAKIAEDSRYNIAARRIAIDNFADLSFLEEVARNVSTPGVREAALQRLAKEGAGEDAAIDTAGEAAAGKELDTDNLETILDNYGSERIVEAIGRFRGSEKAIRSLGLVARKGKEGSERAVHYLEKGAEHSNPHIRACALEELSGTLPKEKAKAIVAKALQDPDAAVRETAGRLQKELSA